MNKTLALVLVLLAIPAAAAFVTIDAKPAGCGQQVLASVIAAGLGARENCTVLDGSQRLFGFVANEDGKYWMNHEFWPKPKLYSAVTVLCSAHRTSAVFAANVSSRKCGFSLGSSSGGSGVHTDALPPPCRYCVPGTSCKCGLPYPGEPPCCPYVPPSCGSKCEHYEQDDYPDEGDY